MVLFFLIIAAFQWCISAGALAYELSPNEKQYLDLLQNQALKLELHESRYWHVLVHYKRIDINRTFYKSEVTQRDFFLSQNGRYEPKEELLKTLESFFVPPVIEPDEDEDGTNDNFPEHPQCRFVDRYQWLKEQLHFDPRFIKEQKCTRLQKWRERLDPSSVTLVFASYYMNNPSSVFGHTLLRMNNRKSSSKHPLLDYGINYGAIRTTNNGLVYAVLGIFGGMPGRFLNIPYYLKVQEYGNIESRDLWEFDLNLSQKQIDRMMNHLWSVGHISFPYYFFDGNCSYMLLALLESSDPEFRFTEHFKNWVIPADTIRVLREQPGLIRKIGMRQSIAAKLMKMREMMTEKQKGIFDKLFGDENDRSDSLKLLGASNNQEAALIIDAALEYLKFAKYKHIRKTKQDELPSAEIKLRDNLLAARNNISTPSNSEDFVSSEAVDQLKRPDLGNKTKRLGILTGRDLRRTWFSELNLRLAFHDINADQTGYPSGSQIEMLTTRLRYYYQQRALNLDSIDVLDVMSLAPMNALFKEKSWSIKIAYDTIKDKICDNCHQARINFGIGAAIGEDHSNTKIYGLAKLESGFSTNFERHFRIGPSVELGALWRIMPKLSFHWNGSYFMPIFGQTMKYGQTGVEGRYSTGEQTDVRLKATWFKATNELAGTMNWYF